MLLVLEIVLTIAIGIFACCWPMVLSKRAVALEATFRRIAHRRSLSVFLVAGVALAARLVALSVEPVPRPFVHDEFGHILIADTFAHGRLTNPTHPMWQHFDTFSIIQRPTYQGFAQPGQGLFLAFGQLVTGHPFWGVWLSIGLMCAAICWMLQAWVGPTWALYGGLLAVIRLAVFSYWGDSYWGGAVGAFSGALVLGALARIWKAPHWKPAILLGLGLLLLANTRPFEGFVFSLPVAVALFVWLFRKKGPEFSAALKQIILPLACVCALGLFATAFYFWRVTGSPLRMPYQIHEVAYAVAPYFIWQPPHPQPAYHHEVFKSLYVDWEMGLHYEPTQTFAGLFAVWALRIWWCWLFFLGPLLTLPILMAVFTAPVGLTWARLSREFRFLVLVFALVSAALAVEIFSIPHYAAPLTCVIYAFLMMAVRSIRGWRWQGKPSGVFITRAVGPLCLLLLVLRAAAGPLHLRMPIWWPPTWAGPGINMPLRYGVQRQLEDLPGQHLVLVRYKPFPQHDPNWEWVFNSADIDSQKIVWARDMGSAKNLELLGYYRGRHIWIVDADDQPPKLSAYPSDSTSPLR